MLRVVRALHKRRGVCESREPKSPSSWQQIALSPSLAIVPRQHKAEQEAQRLLLGNPLTDNDIVFSRSDGSPLHPGTIRQAFARILSRAGLSPHSVP